MHLLTDFNAISCFLSKNIKLIVFILESYYVILNFDFWF